MVKKVIITIAYFARYNHNFTAELSKSQTLVLIQNLWKNGKIISWKNAFTGFCKENEIFFSTEKIISRKNALTVIDLPNHQKKSLTHILIFLDYEVLLS